MDRNREHPTALSPEGESTSLLWGGRIVKNFAWNRRAPHASGAYPH